MKDRKLRIALVAGTLGKGGAEKQLVYIARSLKHMEIEVNVYSLTKSEYYENVLIQAGVPVIWFGRSSNVIIRLMRLTREMIHYRPDYLQACHPFTNLYVAIAARLSGTVDIGAVRSNVAYELQGNGFWGPWLLKLPRWLLTNSFFAQERLKEFGRKHNILTLPNSIDIHEFDKIAAVETTKIPHDHKSLTLVTVASLIRAKRIDRFLEILSMVHLSFPLVKGIVIGDGPEQKNLKTLAAQLNLTDETLSFYGARNDIPALLTQCDIFLLTSDTEGFPNVLLEAMAARLPIITTPAGDSAKIIAEGISGYVVDFDDIEGFVRHILALSKSRSLRKKLGETARLHAETVYSEDYLAEQLLAIYSHIQEKVSA